MTQSILPLPALLVVGTLPTLAHSTHSLMVRPFTDTKDLWDLCYPWSPSVAAPHCVCHFQLHFHVRPASLVFCHDSRLYARTAH